MYRFWEGFEKNLVILILGHFAIFFRERDKNSTHDVGMWTGMEMGMGMGMGMEMG